MLQREAILATCSVVKERRGFFFAKKPQWSRARKCDIVSGASARRARAAQCARKNWVDARKMAAIE